MITVCIMEPETAKRVEVRLPLDRGSLLCALRAGGIQYDPCEIFMDGEDDVQVELKGETVRPILPLIRWYHTLEDINLYAHFMNVLPRRSRSILHNAIHAGDCKTLEEVTMKCQELAMKRGAHQELFRCTVHTIPAQQGTASDAGKPILPELLFEVRNTMQDLWKTCAGTYPTAFGNLLAVSWNVVPCKDGLEGYVECLLPDAISSEQRSALAHWIDEQNNGTFGKLMSEHPIETDTCDLVLSWGTAAASEYDKTSVFPATPSCKATFLTRS